MFSHCKDGPVLRELNAQRCGSMRHTKLEAKRPRKLAFCHRRALPEESEGEHLDQRVPEADLDITSPTDQTSVSHLEKWHEAQETVIIFDWDDTIFPTSFIWSDDRLHWSIPAPCFADGSAADVPAFPERPDGPAMRDMLQQHEQTAAALLKLATSLGRVVIVTLAHEGWVKTSIRNFLPGLEGLLEQLGIEVVHARNSIPARFLRGVREDEGYDVHKALKAKAMELVVRRFYSRKSNDLQTRGQSRSWKNVLSIGDSSAERLALQDVVFRRQQVDRRGIYKECRGKCVKLLSEPSLGILTIELQVLLSWMHALVRHDGDLDVDFSDLDEGSPLSPNIKAWHQQQS